MNHTKTSTPYLKPVEVSNLLSTFPIVKCCNTGRLNLQLFAEGAAASPSQAGAVGDSAASQGSEAVQQDSAKQGSTGEGLSRAAKRQAIASGEKQAEKNPLSSVQYGKATDAEQAAAAPQTVAQGESTQSATAQRESTQSKTATNTEQEVAQPTQTAQEKAATFEKMIRGEYKEQYSARTQNLINQRFKEVKQLEAKSQAADTLMGQLAKRYGVNSKDATAILKAAQADDSYTEREANTRGLSVEEMRRVKQLESENAQLRSSAQQRSAKDAASRLYQTWMADGEKLKAIYPEFDLQTEAKNSAFAKMIKAGVPLQKAYEANHLEQLLGGAMQYTADQVAKGMAARIADRSARPAENGTTPHAGAVVKPDVAGLSRADREEIERRVMRGEKILF